jgi:hypothetical protein
VDAEVSRRVLPRHRFCGRDWRKLRCLQRLAFDDSITRSKEICWDDNALFFFFTDALGDLLRFQSSAPVGFAPS